MNVSLEEVFKTTKKLLKKNRRIYSGGFFQLFSFFFYKFYHLKVLQTSEKTKSKEATL